MIFNFIGNKLYAIFSLIILGTIALVKAFFYSIVVNRDYWINRNPHPLKRIFFLSPFAVINYAMALLTLAFAGIPAFGAIFMIAVVVYGWIYLFTKISEFRYNLDDLMYGEKR
jgi:hypothetical protein